MSLVNYATREITCKIVYYGPGRSGKTSNLHYIYGQVPEDRKGKMVSLATQTDRTLFFDFLPLDLGRALRRARARAEPAPEVSPGRPRPRAARLPAPERGRS